MKKEYLEHIFEPFSQEQPGARGIYPGLGLGMSIVKSLVDQMGGTIQVESEENVGSTITLELPFEAVSEAEKQEEPAAGEKLQDETSLDSRSELAGMKILLAEDNELNLEIAKQLLEEAGASVTAVENGQEAVDAYLAEPAGTFQAVLLDIMMPVMNGYEAARAIRSSGRRDAEEIPLAAVTAYVSEEAKIESFYSGIRVFLTKPLDGAKLVRTVALMGHGREVPISDRTAGTSAGSR